MFLSAHVFMLALEDMAYISIDLIMEIRLKSEETKSITLGLIRYLSKKDK
jgi:hypothetical protein